MSFAVAEVESKLWPDEQHIEAAVLIDIEERAAIADGLQNIEWTGARYRPLILDARSLGNVHKTYRSCLSFLPSTL